MYGKGIYHMGEVIDLGVKEGLVDKSGAWYAYNGDKIGQGKANASKYLEENSAIAVEIETEIRKRLLAAAPEAEKEEDASENLDLI
jgi:recombination protein RecA